MICTTTIIETQWGKAIKAPAPIDIFLTLTRAWEKEGYGLLSIQLCEPLGACAVVVKTQADADAWMKELGMGPDNPDWLKSGDTGISSKTIYATMTGKWTCLSGGMDDAGAPWDSADFGRCHRLLLRHPEWRARLGEVANKFKAWKGLVKNWDELTELFVQNKHKQLNARIDELRWKP